MKRKGWLIPILVFSIFILFLFSYQQRQDVVSFADTTTLTPILWRKNSADITRVVYSSQGKTIDAYRENENWIISDSKQRSADALYIYNVITPFMEPLFEQMVEKDPTDLTLYGIDERSASLTLYDTQEHEYTLKKGKMATKTSTYVYAPLTNTVYTMNPSAFDKISISPDEWESKKLITFEMEDVAKINLVYKGNYATLFPIKDEKGIVFTSPKLDNTLVNAFINFLETTRIQGSITKNANPLVQSIWF